MTEEQPKEAAPQEESLFDKAEVSEEQGVPEELPTEEDDDSEDEIQVSDESPKARLERMGKKEKADGKTLTVKDYSFTKIKSKDSNGARIEPKLTQKSSKPYYPGKLRLRFEEDNLVEVYPNFHYYVDEKGVINRNAKINRTGDNEISKLFKLAVPLMGLPEDEISDKAFYEFLKGKKVVIKLKEGVFNGKPWFRNDIAKILVD